VPVNSSLRAMEAVKPIASAITQPRHDEDATPVQLPMMSIGDGKAGQ